MQPEDRVLVAAADYEVRYRDFDDSHTVPPEISCEAVDWFLEEKK